MFGAYRAFDTALCLRGIEKNLRCCRVKEDCTDNSASNAIVVFFFSMNFVKFFFI